MGGVQWEVQARVVKSRWMESRRGSGNLRGTYRRQDGLCHQPLLLSRCGGLENEIELIT